MIPNDKHDVCDKQFIHDQRLFRLELTPSEQKNTLRYLKLEHLPQSGLDIPESEKKREQAIDEKFRSRWREITDRPRYRCLAELPRSGRSRQLLCVTASGGIGKSIALAQLAAIRPQVQAGHLVFSFHISDLPDRWEQYLNERRTTVVVETDERGRKLEKTKKLEPLLIENLLNRFARMDQSRAPKLPDDQSKRYRQLRDWIFAEIRKGNVTIAVDGLDEFPASDGREKVQAVRILLSHYDRLHCVVGGRPNAITNDYWLELFATSDNPNRSDESSQWEFWLAGLFDSEQIRRDLGNARFRQLQLLQGNIEFNPRTLDILRTLEIETFKTLRSGADVYWHSVDRSLQLDSKKKGQDSQTFLGHHERIDILSAMAITMLMWKHDPLDEVATRKSRRKRKAPNEEELPNSEPVRQITNTELPKFYGLVEKRLMMIYRKWGTKGWPTATEHIKELMRLNTQFLEVTYLIDNEESLQWRNVTQRDFFAALWMTRSASKNESEWFMARPSWVVVGRSSHLSRFGKVAQAWRFICGVPDKSFILRDGEDDKYERWSQMTESLFDPSTNYSRPTELMYLAWPNLLRRSEFLDRSDWQEVDLETARDEALGALAKWQKEKGEINWEREIVFKFLDEYQQILRGERGTEAKQIVHRDMEDHWCDCETAAGKQVWPGHSKGYDYRPREMRLDRAFVLCAYPVTNRLYALFDVNYSVRFGDYEEYCDAPVFPAVFLTYYDSIIFSYWCDSIVLNEWDWFRGRAFVRGAKNPIGTVSFRFGEWCSNRFVPNGDSRTIRGASFSDNAFNVRYSFQTHLNPSVTSHNIGCRVARPAPPNESGVQETQTTNSR